MQYSEGVPYRSATAAITADNLQCTEYRVSTTNNVVEGFICVKKGQTLEINCKVVIDTDDCQVDLIIDGILRESMTSRKKSAHRKNFAFKHGIYKIKRKTWKGSIKVSDLDLGNFNPISPTKVGTIELRIARAENLFTHPQTVPAYYEVANWRDLPLPFGNGGVDPKYQISFEDDEQLTNSMGATVRDKIRRPRPGQSTWATFRFLYRDEASLRNAGLMIPSPITVIARASSPASTRSSTTSRESTPISKNPKPTTINPTPALSDLAPGPRDLTPSPANSVPAPSLPGAAKKVLSRSTDIPSDLLRVSTPAPTASIPTRSGSTPVARVSIFGPTNPAPLSGETVSAQGDPKSVARVTSLSSAPGMKAALVLPASEAPETPSSSTASTVLDTKRDGHNQLVAPLNTVIPQIHIKSEHPIIKVEKVHDSNDKDTARIPMSVPLAANAKGPQWTAHSRATVERGPRAIKGLGLDLSQVWSSEQVDELPLDTASVHEVSDNASVEKSLRPKALEDLNPRPDMPKPDKASAVPPGAHAASEQEAIRLNNLSLSDLHQQVLTPSTSGKNLGVHITSTGGSVRDRQNSLFLTPGPEERLLLGRMTRDLIQQTPVHKGPTPTRHLEERDRQMSKHPDEQPEPQLVTRSGSKRPFDSADYARQSIETPSVNDQDQLETKRRKKDIKTLEAEIASLAKEKAESARRREEARKRIEEHDSIMTAKYEALERKKQEILRCIEEDRKAEEAYLNRQRELEDESS
ncbi:MAG: hypothetical protein Q9187_005346 [Circinaria calcarea]